MNALTTVRYIDANKLMSDLCLRSCYNRENRCDNDSAANEDLAIVEMVKKMPTVDAEPVRHGRWMKCQGKSNIWYCSECGEKINYKQNRRTYNIPKVPVWQKNKRCRNCGAKMDGGKDDLL